MTPDPFESPQGPALWIGAVRAVDDRTAGPQILAARPGTPVYRGDGAMTPDPFESPAEFAEQTRGHLFPNLDIWLSGSRRRDDR